MSSITEFLDAPDSALLVAIDGGVELVTTRHETATKLTIERFPLGPVVNIDAVTALLELNNVRPAPIAASTARPALAAPVASEDRSYECPTCGKGFNRASQLIRHERTIHSEVAAKADAPCPVCGHNCRGFSGLQIHIAKKHKEVQASKPTPIVSPAPVAPPPGPPVVAAMPADPRGMCDACGMPNRNHLACEECARRIGPGHVVEAPARQHRGKVWCASCVEILRQQTAHSGKAAKV